MLTPAAGVEGVKDFIIDCVKTAGPDACPPLILGVGVGGTFEKAALLSKRALFREVGSANPDPTLVAILQLDTLARFAESDNAKIVVPFESAGLLGAAQVLRAVLDAAPSPDSVS